MSIHRAGVAARSRKLVAQRRLLCSASLVALALAPMPALAGGGSTWVSGSGDYNTASNWTPNGVPGSAGTNAIITNGGGPTATINVSSAVAPDSLTFSLNNSTNFTLTGSTITIGSGGIVDNSVNQLNIIANTIAGTGGVTHNGDFALILSADNSYSGTTTINSGTIQIGNNGSTGSFGTGNIVDNGTLAANHTGTFTIANAISGTGRIQQLNGTMILTGANSYGDTDIENSTIQVGNGGTTGSLGTGNVTLNGALIFNQSSLVSQFSGTIASGTGSLTQAGSGTLLIINNNSFSGGTTINAGGAIQLGNNGATGSLGSGSITDNGSLTFARTGTYSPANVISGSGSVTIGNGTVNFAGLTETYTGATAIAPGTTLALQDTASIAASSGLTDNGTFDITSAAFSSVNIKSLNGSGVVALGTHSLNITNGSGIFSGTTTGTGAFTVSGGQLSFNGTTGAIVTVNSGGTLKGNGTIGGFSASSGSTVAPGNSIGTLNVAGNIAFASGSVYQAEVDNTGASDKIIATGTATISNGAAVNVVASAGTYGASTNYTIINATGGVTGTFGSVTSNLAFLSPSLSYTANSVVLTLVPSATFPSVATTPNQIATATALQALGTGSLFTAVQGGSTSTALAAFDASSGEIYATTLSTQLQAATAARRTVLERMRHTDPDQGWSLWGAIANDWGNINGDGNAAKTARTGVDVTVGVDTVFSTHWGIGLEGGYNGGTLSVAARNSHAAISDGHVGAYTWGSFDGFVARGGFYYGYGTDQTSRAIAFTGFSDTATARQDTRTSQLYGEVGYDFDLGPVTLEPFGGLDWTNIYLGRFKETGGAAALAGAARYLDSNYLTMGVQATPQTFDLFGVSLAPMVRAAWQHSFTVRTPSRTLSFLAGGPSFTVFGAPLDGDRALLDVGAGISLSDSASVSLGYSGSFGAHATDHTVKLTGEIKL